MAITYRTAGDWGAGKGANLTPAEVDENFWEAIQRIISLEEDPPQAADISNIEVIGTQMKIYLSNGDEYGPYTLPYVMFRSRGEWVGGENYAFLDLVTVKGRGLYFVNVSHTADAEFDPSKQISGEDVYTLVFGESSYVYSFGIFYPMRPGQGIAADSYMAAHILAYAITLPAGLEGSVAKLRVAPAVDLVMNIFDQDATALGSITFSAGETDGVFAFDNEWVGEVGDYVYVAPPTVVDDAARDLMVTIVGSRNL